MAITYDVCTRRTENAQMSKGSQRDALRIAWNVTLDVYVSDPENPDFQPGDVTTIDVLFAPGVPIVNRTVYYQNGLIIPFLVCRDKTATRDPSNASHFIVNCRFDTGTANNNTEGDNQPQTPPAALTSIAPREESQLLEEERVLYVDKSSSEKPCLTPTRNLFDSPFIERLPVLELRITQYEASIDYQTMLDRKFKVNEGTYRTKPRYSWLITEVDATEVEVQLAGGPTLAALVTYTVQLSPFDYGWKDQRALIDTHYLDETDGDKKKAHRDDELDTYTIVKVDFFGYKIPDQSGKPDYGEWETYDTIDFSFLQV